jgi:Xaa-Pro dipeptidase
MIKAAAEMERVEHIAGIVSEGFAALPALIGAGYTERDVFRWLQADLIRRGAEKTPYVVYV